MIIKTINKIFQQLLLLKISTRMKEVWNLLKLNLIMLFWNNYFMFFTLSIFSLIIFEIVFLKEIYAVDKVYATIYDEINNIPKEIINTEWRMPQEPYKTPEIYFKSAAGPDGNDIIKEESQEYPNKHGADSYIFLTIWVCGFLLCVLNGQ